MNRYKNIRLLLLVCMLSLVLAGGLLAAEESPRDAQAFPPSLESYNDAGVHSIIAILPKPIATVLESSSPVGKPNYMMLSAKPNH